MKKKTRYKTLARSALRTGDKALPREHWNADGSPKHTYKTLREAQESADFFMRKNSDAGLEPYRCTICGMWHLGHRYHLNTGEWLDLMEARELQRERIIEDMRKDIQSISAQINRISARLKQLSPTNTKKL